MRTLLILVAVSYCSAQVILPYAAHWPLVAPPKLKEIKTLPMASTYMHPFGHPLAAPLGYPYGYLLNPAKAEAPAAEASRRRRDVAEVSVPLPYLHPVPAIATTTLTTKQLEPVEAATPADTTKLDIITKEHEFKTPTVRFVQPVMNVKPVTYSAISPALFPWMVTA